MADRIDELLRTDSLQQAEDITGESYKNDDATSALGMLIQMSKGRELDALLREAGDTTFSNELDRYQSIIEGVGFEQALAVPFVSQWNRAENLFVYARRDGLLLVFDTFATDRVNGGHLYYQWRPAIDDFWSVTSSGGMRGDVWCGYHDCREALLRKIKGLTDNGAFVAPWEHEEFLWLLHHGDTKVEGYDHRAITAERIAMLPEWVRQMLGPCAAPPAA